MYDFLEVLLVYCLCDNRVKLFPHKLVITQSTLVEILVTLISLKFFS